MCVFFSFINLVQGDQPLPDEAFSASSFINPYFAPKNARFTNVLPHDSAGYWSPKESQKNEYLQIDLGRQEPVYGVIIAGSRLYNEFVTSYQVMYSPDGKYFSFVTDADRNPKVNNFLKLKEDFNFSFI